MKCQPACASDLEGHLRPPAPSWPCRGVSQGANANAVHNTSIRIVIKCGEGYGTRIWDGELGRDKVALDKTESPPGVSSAVGETQGERVTKFVVSQGVTNFMRSHEAGEWEDPVPQGSTQGGRRDLVWGVPFGWALRWSGAGCRESLGESGPGRRGTGRAEPDRGRHLRGRGCGKALRPACGVAENKARHDPRVQSIAWRFCSDPGEVAGVASKGGGRPVFR